MATGPTLPPQAYTREILTAAFNWLQAQPESVKKLATTPDALVGLYMRAQRFGSSSLEADAPVSSQSFMSDLKNLAEGLKQFESPKQAASAIAAAAAAANAANLGSGSSSGPSPVAGQQPGASAHNGLGASAQFSSSNSTAAASFLTSNTSTTASMNIPPFSAPVQQSLNFNPVPQHAPSASPLSQPIAQPIAQPHVQPMVQPNASPLTQQNFSAAPAANPNSTTLSTITYTLNERTLMMIQEVKTYFNLSNDAEAINLLVSIAYKNLKNLIG